MSETSLLITEAKIDNSRLRVLFLWCLDVCETSEFSRFVLPSKSHALSVSVPTMAASLLRNSLSLDKLKSTTTFLLSGYNSATRRFCTMPIPSSDQSAVVSTATEVRRRYNRVVVPKER